MSIKGTWLIPTRFAWGLATEPELHRTSRTSGMTVETMSAWERKTPWNGIANRIVFTVVL